jgi:hypothetical protein
MCKSFAASEPPPDMDSARPRAFVYVSAEDIFRPWIPAGYIRSKRQAETLIDGIVAGRDDMRAVFVRPSTRLLHLV